MSDKIPTPRKMASTFGLPPSSDLRQAHENGIRAERERTIADLWRRIGEIDHETSGAPDESARLSALAQGVALRKVLADLLASLAGDDS